ncbi:hypothetical protein GCM10018980_40090 [Streptomyces capoamus]|uniref:Uncharacterized protein n=1 Tax=Streptomyces capoamus TaxID=68183 RepID=A0A919EXE1_9ACTN|nr:hypothetical protein [Streptomyces capoamus]GGW15166.1 hypothetical protein GCM10010501_26090 [Streptomyces libani subsp. rufus]GHG54989.1 hypothetical protein GCM10018980_40090 [Streptomyces capoamus]
MGELMRRQGQAPMSRQTRNTLMGMAEGAQIEQAATRALSAVADYAMGEVLYLKQTQAMLEQQCPDAAEALALIANTAAMSIAHQVRRYGSEMSG